MISDLVLEDLDKLARADMLDHAKPDTVRAVVELVKVYRLARRFSVLLADADSPAPKSDEAPCASRLSPILARFAEQDRAAKLEAELKNFLSAFDGYFELRGAKGQLGSPQVAHDAKQAMLSAAEQARAFDGPEQTAPADPVLDVDALEQEAREASTTFVAGPFALRCLRLIAAYRALAKLRADGAPLELRSDALSLAITELIGGAVERGLNAFACRDLLTKIRELIADPVESPQADLAGDNLDDVNAGIAEAIMAAIRAHPGGGLTYTPPGGEPVTIGITPRTDAQTIPVLKDGWRITGGSPVKFSQPAGPLEAGREYRCATCRDSGFVLKPVGMNGGRVKAECPDCQASAPAGVTAAGMVVAGDNPPWDDCSPLELRMLAAEVTQVAARELLEAMASEDWALAEHCGDCPEWRNKGPAPDCNCGWEPIRAARAKLAAAVGWKREEVTP